MKGKRRTRCMVLTVDGVPVRARVSGNLTERDLEALREIARAAMRFRPADSETTIHLGKVSAVVPAKAEKL